MLFRARKQVNRRVTRREPLYWRSRSALDWLSLSAKFFAGILVFIGFYQIFFVSSTFKLQDVNVVGDFQSITQKNLLTLAEIPYGKNIFAVNLYAVVERIKKNPWISEVQVRRRFPNSLLIRIKEYEPVAVLEALRPNMEPNYYLVSENGFFFKKTVARATEELPVISGFEEAQLKKYPLYFGEKTSIAFGALKQFRENPANQDIEVKKIHYSLTEGLHVNIQSKKNETQRAELYFGQDDFTEKLNRWVHFVPAMIREDGSFNYGLVDLHVDGKIFARL